MKSKLLLIILVTFIQCGYGQQIFSHNPGIFLGSKFINSNQNFAPAFGLNYEYKLKDSDIQTGFGMVSEIKFTNQVEFIIGPALYIHPINPLSLFIAPSLFYANFGEIAESNNLSYIEINERTGQQFKFVLRFGASYEFPISILNLSPMIGVDLIGNNVEAYFGINVSAPLEF